LTTAVIDRARLAELYAAEQRRFTDTHPASLALARRAQGSLLDGVPMHWMAKWAGGFPLFVREGRGAWFTDVDGLRYLDLCLGDTGAMTGHAPPATVEAVRRQAERGFTFMLPSEDHLWVAEELTRRFGLAAWQFAMTATDANRFALRLARMLTGRPKILVHNWCYHGTVDETFATLRDGRVGPRAGNVGPPVDPALTTRVVEFNDVRGLEAALAHGDVACVLAEPVMTNVGIIHPEPGYHQALRDLTRAHGALLILDETHTICAGPGGYTAAHRLAPDILTLGKPIGGGVPGAVYGFSREVGERLAGKVPLADCDTGGIGGTLAGNALALAAMRATLEHVLTDGAYARTIPLAERFQQGVEGVISEFNLPWIVKRLGCRAEYWFRPAPPRNGAEAAAAADFELDRFMHLFALNRGILLTPFHNMALIAPETKPDDIDRHTAVFRESVKALLGRV
jgi:glutamate-1-semialdehyde 2,1-aminomutase